MSTKGTRFVTTTKFARWCDVDIKTIHNWTDKGDIPSFRTPGNHRRYTPEAVLAVLKKYGFPIPDELTAMLTVAPTSTGAPPTQSAA